MRLIVSADKKTVINADNVKWIYVNDRMSPDNSSIIYADTIELSNHTNPEEAMKEFNRLLSVLSSSDSFLYQSRNS